PSTAPNFLDQRGGPASAPISKKMEGNRSPPFSTYSVLGGLRQDPGRGAESSAMRVLLSTYGGRGDVEPLVGLAVAVQALGAEARVCAPPDWAERLAQFGVPLVPIGPSVRELMHGRTPAAAKGVPQFAAEL